MTATTLNIIGGGRVARTLGHLWSQRGAFVVQDLYDVTRDSAQQAVAFIGSGTPVDTLDKMRPADVWMIATPDTQLQRAADTLSEHLLGRGKAIAFHCSGALGAQVLSSLRDRGWSTASAHPVLSFADPAIAVAQFDGTPCGLEGDAAARAEVTRALSAIGARCFDVDAAHKRLYHGGAVFASNFLPVLVAIADDLWRSAGVPADLIAHMTKTLVSNSVDNVLALGPRAALTGPAARGDTAVVAAQGDSIAQEDGGMADAYRVLSRLAQQLAQDGTVRAGGKAA